MRIVIVGAGPTGLAAGYRLHELGYEEFLVLEERHHAGGLAASELSPGGFTYDIGGHVLFSHFRYFDELFERLLGDDYQELQRDAWIWMQDRFLPYPFQNNIKDLPAEIVLECVLGIVEARGAPDARLYADFQKLIYGVFGRGIAEHFMMPYNFKVWAHPPGMLATSWIGERVPVVDLERVLRNVILDHEDRSWGPNNTFKYPRHGGTGGLFARIVPPLGDRIRFGARVTGIDTRHKRVRLEGGTDEPYDVLISTMPLDLLIDLLDEAPTTVRESARLLAHSGSAIVGVGLRQPAPSPKCWMYFPEPNCPFYRVTYLSNYSPEVVPDPATHYSLLAEVSHSPYKPVNLETVVEEVLDGFVNTGLLDRDDLRDVVDTHLIYREHTYPVPTLRRDEALAAILPHLESREIYSRGRFGSWKYEVGNMDHSVQMGVECVERVVHGRPEECVHNHIRPKAEQDLRLIAEAAMPERAGAAFRFGLGIGAPRPNAGRRQHERKVSASSPRARSRGRPAGTGSRGDAVPKTKGARRRG